MKSSNLAYVYGMAAVFLWSTVATAFKIALSYYSPLQLVFVAVLTSIIALTSILAWQKKLSLLKQQFLRRPMFYLVTGLINPFLYYVVLFKAYSLLPAQQALSLNYTWAVLLPLLAAPLLKQHLRKSDIAAALIAYTGVFIIATGGDISGFSFDSPLGIGLALTSTLLWCLYWIVNTKDQGDPVVSLLLSFLIGLPFIAMTLVLTDALPSFSLKAIFAGMYVGLFEMGITFVLWLMALKTATRTANISTMVFLSPVMSIGFIAWILQETIAMTTYLGLAFILSGMMLQQLFPRYTERKRSGKPEEVTPKIME
ncbi:DMT family transporter [Shewanella sp. JNE10-2]|uniref:DMT family transporter n=1 Tax=unclassified Shewanella TaxID=196818 RepID=UPI0020030AAE|nr:MULTISPECIES: DMT family transporter [unclassified Shewanella]MCK7630138.1 DMT family transporter [Shewanella sp. JNE9-1]MCK7635159.1 DMT family transporter [Shewanella sp. JNE17]MCK7645360.1 DMT family transporter [Shewanella sp. JNE3-1]MCK7650364.1 DMT family transporter [Shewanella sp. JNE8]MCK7653297.1 DMT family transporter [Shewanella sp. JNE4-1]